MEDVDDFGVGRREGKMVGTAGPWRALLCWTERSQVGRKDSERHREHVCRIPHKPSCSSCSRLTEAGLGVH